jgi:hypothetical protein
MGSSTPPSSRNRNGTGKVGWRRCRRRTSVFARRRCSNCPISSITGLQSCIPSPITRRRRAEGPPVRGVTRPRRSRGMRSLMLRIPTCSCVLLDGRRTFTLTIPRLGFMPPAPAPRKETPLTDLGGSVWTGRDKRGECRDHAAYNVPLEQR